MSKPSIPNSPSQQNSNRPSSPLKGARGISRSVSGQTSKPATPGKQCRTVSSSPANGKEGIVPVKLSTIQSEFREAQNPTLFTSLPDPAVFSQKSTPHKADKLRSVPPLSQETTPEKYKRSPRGCYTVTPTTRPIFDSFIISREKTSSEMGIAGASNRSAQPKYSGIADSSIDVDSMSSTELQPSLQTPKPKSSVAGKQRRRVSSPIASENIGFSKNPASPVNASTVQSDLAERQKPALLPSVSDPAQFLHEPKPRESEKLAAGSPRPLDGFREVGKNGRSTNVNGPAAHASKHSPSVLVFQELSNSSQCARSLTESSKSCTADPIYLSSVPDFLAWSPASEVNEKEISGSSATRIPAPWDKHLHENFILKKVVSAPDLTSRLGEIADSALKQARANLPNHCKPDQLAEKMKTLGTTCIKNTKFEGEVRDFYKESIAPPCLATAGVLGFGTAGDFLKWRPELYEQRRAKADGFLVVADNGSDFLALPNIFKKRIELLEEWNLNVLAIWEFKSLAAGSKDIMRAIQGLSSQERFSWTGCTPHNQCDSTHYHPSDSSLPRNTGRRTSPDSLEPLIDSLPKVAKCSPEVITSLADTTDHAPNVDGDKTMSYDDDTSPNDEDTNDEDTSPNGEDTSLNDDRPENEAQWPSAKGSQVKSEHIIQQAWAEAVHNDATFMVINAGLYEVIGLRHRESPTLYLSNIIEISKFALGYGKLQTGLYLAAFNDALDRAQQLDRLRISGSRSNYLYRRKYPDDKLKYNHEDPRNMDSQRLEESQKAKEKAASFTTLCERLKCCREVKVEATVPIFGVHTVQHFNRFDIGELVESEPDTFGVEHFIRIKPVDSEPEVPNNLQLMLKPLGGCVYNCNATLNGEPVVGRFVMKLAQRQEHHEILLREYKMYLKLKERGFKGIVEVYGLFWCDAPCPGMGRMGLLMSHGGRSLLHKKELESLVRQRTVRQQFEEIVSALKQNRIDHRGLLLEHLLLNTSNGVSGPEFTLSLISWGSAKWLMREEWQTNNEGAEIIRDFWGERE